MKICGAPAYHGVRRALELVAGYMIYYSDGESARKWIQYGHHVVIDIASP